jgi:hypothetical protein
LVAGVGREELERSRAHLDAAAPRLAAIADPTIREELSLGADLALAGLRRAEGGSARPEERETLRERFRTAWLKRARPGGLTESVELLFG